MKAIPKRWITILFVELSNHLSMLQVAIFVSYAENLLYGAITSLENALGTHSSSPYIGHINSDGLQRCKRCDKMRIYKSRSIVH